MRLTLAFSEYPMAPPPPLLWYLLWFQDNFWNVPFDQNVTGFPRDRNIQIKSKCLLLEKMVVQGCRKRNCTLLLTGRVTDPDEVDRGPRKKTGSGSCRQEKPDPVPIY